MGLGETDVIQVIEFGFIYLVIKIIETDIQNHEEEINYGIYGYCILAGHNDYIPHNYSVNEFIEILLAYRKETEEFYIITKKGKAIIDRKVYVIKKKWEEAISFFSL